MSHIQWWNNASVSVKKRKDLACIIKHWHVRGRGASGLRDQGIKCSKDLSVVFVFLRWCDPEFIHQTAPRCQWTRPRASRRRRCPSARGPRRPSPTRLEASGGESVDHSWKQKVYVISNLQSATFTSQNIQGDHSGCSLGLDDIKTKVAFSISLLY